MTGVATLFLARDHLRRQALVRWRTPGAKAGPPTVGPAQSEPIIIGQAESIVIGPAREQILVIRPAETMVVGPPPRGAWDERGWQRRIEKGHQTYEGEYQVKNVHTGQIERFRGRVIAEPKMAIAYIADPPPSIKRHPKGPCFMLLSAPWFRLNWAHPAKNVDDAILYVEKVLSEAINGR